MSETTRDPRRYPMKGDVFKKGQAKRTIELNSHGLVWYISRSKRSAYLPIVVHRAD